MKVLHVYKTYLPHDFTGIPRVIHAIAQGSASRGITTRILILSHDKANSAPYRVENHWVHPVRQDIEIASAGFSVSAFGAFARLAAQADVVNYHFPWPMADLLYLAHGRQKPSVVTYHSDIVRQKWLAAAYAPVMDAFLSRVDAIVATSPNYRATSPVLARYDDKVRVIPIGISGRPAVDPDLRDRWRARLGENFFLFVGTLRYYKGIATLLAAARQSGLPTVLAGRNDRDELDIAMLPANARYVGEVSDADKEALLDLCAAFVFPSHLRSEAFGIALLEAARAGKPMISCEIGTGTSYVNADGETGYTVPPGDPEAFAAAMARLAAETPLSARLGANARARYERLFTARTMADSYVALYRALAKK